MTARAKIRRDLQVNALYRAALKIRNAANATAAYRIIYATRVTQKEVPAPVGEEREPHSRVAQVVKPPPLDAWSKLSLNRRHTVARLELSGNLREMRADQPERRGKRPRALFWGAQ
jgi:hypothetical protein